MQKFPNLSPLQVALVRAETSTGTILDEQFQYALNDSQQVYSIYNSVDDAMKYVDAMLLERKGNEFIIFNHEEKLLKFIEPKH